MLNTPDIAEHKLSFAQIILAASLVPLIASPVLREPLGIVWRGERHLLLLAITVSAGWQLWRGEGSAVRCVLKKHAVILMPAIFFCVTLLWVFPLAGHSREELQYAAMDIQALVFLPITVLVFLSMREHTMYFHRLVRIALFLCALLAAAQSGIWLFLRFNPLPQDVIFDYVEIFFGTRESVYILEQPSYQGAYFRVVWISRYWLLFAVFLAPLFIRSRAALFLMQTCFGMAIIASSTRGTWLGLLVGFFVLLLMIKTPAKAKGRPVDLAPWRSSVLGLVFSILLVLTADWVQSKADLFLSRLYINGAPVAAAESVEKAIKIKDDSAIERAVQTQRLIEKWRERPAFGHGYGAYVKNHFSHKERPFLYEMVPFALLMKLGVVGFGLYLSFLGFVLFRLWRLAAPFGSAAALLAGLAAYLVQVHTNPVFFSFTGMLIFSILLYFWMTLELRGKQATPSYA